MKHLEPLQDSKLCLKSCSDIHRVNLTFNSADGAWTQWTYSLNVLQTKLPVQISFYKQSLLVLSDTTFKLLLEILAFGPGHAYLPNPSQYAF